MVEEIKQSKSEKFLVGLMLILIIIIFYIFVILPNKCLFVKDYDPKKINFEKPQNISVLKNHFSDFGVLYPLQTFKKDIEMKINNVPFLIEANNKIFENKLFDLASSFSNKVEKVNSKERKKIHLAAVIACNFSNHMLVLAKNIMKNSNLEFSLLLPLIKKTFSQINDNPIKLQTGPASRKDMRVINEHLELIKDKNINFLYELISKSIIDSNEKNS